MHTLTEEIETSLGELETIKSRVAAALRLAGHPDHKLTIYLFELAAIQLLCMLEELRSRTPQHALVADSQWLTPPLGSKLKH
jgi:hypothetical protein